VLRIQHKPSGPGGKFTTYTLTLPTPMAELLEANGVSMFTVELTEDGVLYRPVVLQAPQMTPLPSWLKEPVA
jgi:hypothetical protein